MFKKILIVGANGQLAYDLIRIFEPTYEVIKAYRSDFDICDKEQTSKFIFKYKPDIIINTAAFHKTLDCEGNPEKSFLVNGVGAYNVSLISKQIGSTIVFISTDYVFDGSKKGFNENDLPNPLNIYGASKLAGEVLTKLANSRNYIVRTGWLFGMKTSGKGHNFVDLMIEKAKAGEKLKVVNDQIGSPTYTFDLANQIKIIIEKRLPFGTYHITNASYCSWYEFAKEIFKQVGLEVHMKKIASDKSDGVRRPKYSILTNKRLVDLGIKPLQSWKKALKDYLTAKY